MAALTVGSKAPLFTLVGLDSASYSLKDSLSKTPTVIAFFKVSCPVCQFAFPYLERLYRSYPNVPLWGISQDDADATAAFARMFGLTFPMLIDQGLDTTVKFDLTNVPSIFYIGTDALIQQTIVGFSKADLEMMNDDMARLSQVAPIPLFTAADEVPALRPG